MKYISPTYYLRLKKFWNDTKTYFKILHIIYLIVINISFRWMRLFIDSLTKYIYVDVKSIDYISLQSQSQYIIKKFYIKKKKTIWIIDPMLANVFEQFSNLEQISRINFIKDGLGLDKKETRQVLFCLSWDECYRIEEVVKYGYVPHAATRMMARQWSAATIATRGIIGCALACRFHQLTTRIGTVDFV